MNMLKNNGTIQGMWMSRGVQKVQNAVWGSSQSISDYFNLKKANDALAQENFRLRLQLEQMMSMHPETSENEFRHLGNIAGNYRFTPAEIAKISNSYRERLIIKCKNSPSFRKLVSECLKEFSNIRMYSKITAFADMNPEGIL